MFESPISMQRRKFLTRSTGGVGLLALAHLLNTESICTASPLSPKIISSGFGKAKSVICLFQHGGPSHLDLFDPKPTLTQWNGKPYPHGDLEVHFSNERGHLLASPFSFRPHGESGIELSTLLPNLASVVDDITLVRSMTTDSVDHESALRNFHTGRRQAGFPTWGSWVSYGLGSECENLPAYVVLSDPHGLPIDGGRNWSAGWLPAIHQGTALRLGDDAPVVNLNTPEEIPKRAREAQLEFIEQLNRHHMREHSENNDLAARLQNFELAARMQTAVPTALDISSETQSTQQMYGLDNGETREYGTRCLVARRLVEQGVRFVQVFLNGQPWDTHKDNEGGLKFLCAKTDQPSAALVRDLKQRGLLESTIVVWGGEFGRLPIAQGTDGRDHNRRGFSLWIAGGGFRSGYVHGETDEFGYQTIRDTVTIHDLHATLLHALGIDHRRLTFPRDGRPTSLTDPEVTDAHVIEALFRST